MVSVSTVLVSISTGDARRLERAETQGFVTCVMFGALGEVERFLRHFERRCANVAEVSAERWG